MDHIEAIEAALAAGPTGANPGDSRWVSVYGSCVMLDSPRPVWARIASCDRDQTAAYIAACHPEALRSLIARLREAEADARRRHELLKMQHAESVELWNALKALSFECDGVTRTDAPSRETYNATFALLQRKLHLSPEALRGYASSPAAATKEAP